MAQFWKGLKRSIQKRLPFRGRNNRRNDITDENVQPNIFPSPSPGSLQMPGSLRESLRGKPITEETVARSPENAGQEIPQAPTDNDQLGTSPNTDDMPPNVQPETL